MDYEQIKPHILAKVRSRRYCHQRMAASVRSQHVSVPLIVDCRWVPAHLCIELVYQSESTTQSIHPRQLKHWAVSSQRLLEIALHNLAGRQTCASGWDQATPGIYVSSWQDSYDSSRLLFPEIFAGLAVNGSPVVVPLSEDEVYITGSDDPNSLRAVVHVVQRRVEHVRIESVRPLVLGDDGQWLEFRPPQDCDAAQHVALLHALDQYYDHDAQKAYLDALANHEGSPIKAATLTFFEKGRSYHSFATWTRGVTTLLPKSDLIAFHEPENRTTTFVPWASAISYVGDLMQPRNECNPIRLLVQNFPDATAMSALKTHRVEVENK